MSYLYRTGNGRNNIAYTNTANSSTKYLRRLGSGRTNINWYTIPAGSTYNILNRTGTGRNNIAWGNLKIGPDTSATALQNNMHLKYWQTTDSSSNKVNIATGNIPPTYSGNRSVYSANKFYYENNRIRFDNWNHPTAQVNWSANNWMGSLFDQYDGYAAGIVFCSSSPPSEYLQAIKSISNKNGTIYSIRMTPKYHVINSYIGLYGLVLSTTSTSNMAFGLRGAEPWYINFA